LFGQAKIDDTDKRTPGGVAYQRSKLCVAQRERAQRRVEMNVCCVNEAICHWDALRTRLQLLIVGYHLLAVSAALRPAAGSERMGYPQVFDRIPRPKPAEIGFGSGRRR
jgi:hypothetical protein